MSLAKGLSILFIFSKNQLSVLLIFAILSLISFSFISAQIFMIFFPSSTGFPDSSVDKDSACNVGDPSLIPGLGRSPGEGKGHPLQYSGLENSTDCIGHGVAKSRTGLSNFDFQETWNGLRD